jgi:hypothetical protein
VDQGDAKWGQHVMVQIVSTFFCYTKFDIAQIGRVHIFAQAVSIIICGGRWSFLLGNTTGGAQVDALEVQAQVGKKTGEQTIVR